MTWSIERDRSGLPRRLWWLGRCLRFGDRIEQPEKVSRLEVIGPNGRTLSVRNITLELHYQDDGRTLKVFYDVRRQTD